MPALAPLALAGAARLRAPARPRARRAASAPRAQFSDDADLAGSGFGEHLFKGEVATRFLAKFGEDARLLATPWAKNPVKADIVAAALRDWAQSNGASVYCHWFQPMGASGFRHGHSGQVYNTMLEFDGAGVPRWKVRAGGCGAVWGRCRRRARAAWALATPARCVARGWRPQGRRSLLHRPCSPNRPHRVSPPSSRARTC